ncbi:MAG: phospholipid methyltransferase [Myxococcales bacterium SG8_38]|nr:MAG: phospholipid methyltransferase [Myxococcales bacterium SG8_38]
MDVYNRYILPWVTNLACSSRPNMKQREKVIPLAEGEVLEVGLGSGLNLPYYDTSKVSKVWGLEPSEGMRRLAHKRVRQSQLELEMLHLRGEEIPLESSTIDTVVVTYTLCSIPDAERALRGMRRVLRPGGRLLFCEHGLAPDEPVRKWQHRINPGWRLLSGGCNVNRDIPGLLESSGFRIVVDERMYIPGAKFLSYNYWGTAVAD